MAKPLPEGQRLASAARIQKARKAAGLSQTALGERLGVIQSVVSDWERGKLESWRDHLPELSRALNVSPADIMPEGVANQNQTWSDRLVSGGPLLDFLPIRFRAQAGAWYEADAYATQSYGDGPIPADPRIPRESQWLEELVGESLDLLIRPSSLLHVIDAIYLGYAPRQDDIVIVERTRFQGAEIERSVKQVAITPGGVELWGRSTNEIWNVPLKLTGGLRDGESGVEVRIAGWVRHAIQKL